MSALLGEYLCLSFPISRNEARNPWWRSRALEILSFPWGILVGTVVLQISAAREDLPGRVLLNGQMVCEVASERSSCRLDLGRAPRVHELVLEDAQSRVRERVWLNRGPWRSRVLLDPQPCDPSYLCFRVSGGHPEKKAMVAFEVSVGGQRWKFSPSQVAKIRAPAVGSVLLVRVHFEDGSVTEHAAIAGPGLFSEVAEATAGFVAVRKPAASFPRSVCGQEVLGEQKEPSAALAFVLEPGALRRLRFWAKQAQLQPRGLKELTWSNPVDARAWDAAQKALESAKRILVLGAFGSLPQLNSPQAFSAMSIRSGPLQRILLASQGADSGGSQRRRTADAVAVAAFHLATYPGPRAVVLVKGDEAVDESVFSLAEVRDYLGELMVPLVVWYSGKPSSGQWPQSRRVLSVGDLALAAQELAVDLQRQTVVWLKGVAHVRRCREDWPSDWRMVGENVGGSNPLEVNAPVSPTPVQNDESDGNAKARPVAFWVKLPEGDMQPSSGAWGVRVGSLLRTGRQIRSFQGAGAGRWPCFAVNSRLLGQAAVGEIRQFLLKQLKANGSLCLIDLESDPMNVWQATSAAELKAWVGTWERRLPRESLRQQLRKSFLQQPGRRSPDGRSAQGKELAAALLAQELNLVRRALGSLLLACEALPPPAALVVISGGLDLHPERFYSRGSQDPLPAYGGLLRDTATEAGESLAARGCLVFAAVVPEATESGELAQWVPQHYDPQVVPPKSEGVVTSDDLSGWQAVTVPAGGRAEALAKFQWHTESRGFLAIELELSEGERLDGALELQGVPKGEKLWYPKRIDAKTHPLVGEELAWRAFHGKDRGFLPVSAELVDPVLNPDGSGMGLLRVKFRVSEQVHSASGEMGRLTACVLCPGTLPAFSAVSLENSKSSWLLDQEIHWPSKECALAAVVEAWSLGSWGAAVLNLPDAVEGKQ